MCCRVKMPTSTPFSSRINSATQSRSRVLLAIDFDELTKHFEAVQHLHGKMIRELRREAVVAKTIDVLDLSADKDDQDEK